MTPIDWCLATMVLVLVISAVRSLHQAYRLKLARVWFESGLEHLRFAREKGKAPKNPYLDE